MELEADRRVGRFHGSGFAAAQSCLLGLIVVDRYRHPPPIGVGLRASKGLAGASLKKVDQCQSHPPEVRNTEGLNREISLLGQRMFQFAGELQHRPGECLQASVREIDGRAVDGAGDPPVGVENEA